MLGNRVLTDNALLLVRPSHNASHMNDLAETTEHPPTLRRAEPPRVDVHVDLYAISHNLQAIKAEIARRPTRMGDPEAGARLLGRSRGRAAAGAVMCSKMGASKRTPASGILSVA